MSPAVKPSAAGPSVAGATDVTPAAMAAAKLGMIDKLLAAIDKQPHLTKARDLEGRTCLHYAAGYGHEECVERLLEKRFDPLLQDQNGDTALHLAAIYGCPMSCFNLAKAAPAACLAKNLKQQRPADVAKACERGEVLNAMLLACSGDAGNTAVEAMDYLLQEGAVPDTWAPNGSSALMLAASVDGVVAIQLLLKHGATIELQDALGRSALMFAAGNCAEAALLALLAADATLGLRDRRSRSVLDYAPDDSKVKRLLHDRLKQLEAAAEQLQAALLAELDTKPAGTAATTTGKKKAKAKKAKKKQAAALVDHAPSSQEASSLQVSHRKATSVANPAPVPQPSELSAEQSTSAEGTGSVTPDRTLEGEENSDAESDNSAAGHHRSPSNPSQSVYASESDSRVAPTHHSAANVSHDDTSASVSDVGVVKDVQVGALSPEHKQKIAVLSLIAGAAADSAAAEADLRPAAGADTSTNAEAHLPAAAEASASSDSSDDDASRNILHALRSDAGVPEQWQVVKASRKAPAHSSKASDRLTDRHGAAATEQSAGSNAKGRDRIYETQPGQTACQNGTEASFVAGKPLRRSSSSASGLSWESASDAFEGSDRLQSRPGALSSARFPKAPVQYGNKTGQTAFFRAPPPPPAGPPPSHAANPSAVISLPSSATQKAISQAFPLHSTNASPVDTAADQAGASATASEAAHSRASSVLTIKSGNSGGCEPRSNAWDQPLAGISLQAQRVQSNIDSAASHSQLANNMHNDQTQMPGTPLDMSRQEHEATLAATGAGQNGMHEEGSAAAEQKPEQACLQAQASTDSAHMLQIEELQAEVEALRGDVAQLFLTLKAAESRHQQELAGVIVDAAQHQTKAVAEAIAKERLAIAAFLKAACNQAGPQQRPVANGVDHRASQHQTGQRRRHSFEHQEANGTRSRFANQNSLNGTQKAPQVPPQGLPRAGLRAEPAVPSNRGQNGWEAGAVGAGLGSLMGPADCVSAMGSDELREGFRRAVGDVAVQTQTQADLTLGENSVSSVFPRVASWGNLSTHSSGSGAGLYHGGASEPASRGLPTFEPLTTPAGIFSSNKSSDKAGFPSYLASIWSDDNKPLNGSPNNHFEQPSLLSNSS